MRDLLVLKARLEELVGQLEELQAIPSPSDEATKRVNACVHMTMGYLRPVGIALNHIKIHLTEGADWESHEERVDEIVAQMSKQTGVPAIDLDAVDLDPELVRYVRREIAVKHQLVVFGLLQEPSGEILLKVAMADPTNIFAADDVKFTTGHNLKAYVAREDAIARAIDKYYADLDPTPPAAASAV